VHRRFHHSQLTFGQLYAYSENFVLPLSHDEVVHGKGSLVGKMPGDDWQKFANLRLLLAYQMTSPGKKLNFMGSELGQRSEWRPAASSTGGCCSTAARRMQRLVRDLNRLYRATPPCTNWISKPGDSPGAIAMMPISRCSATCACARDGSFVLVALNFTPVPRRGYRIGVPRTGGYIEVFNSDSALYGGSDLGNGGRCNTPPPRCNCAAALAVSPQALISGPALAWPQRLPSAWSRSWVRPLFSVLPPVWRRCPPI
jgi:1,4-alpha-glucan branching enzyme